MEVKCRGGISAFQDYGSGWIEEAGLPTPEDNTEILAKS